MYNHLVVFIVAKEHYGASIDAVKEIVELQPITVVPRAPEFVEGVTNLRGKVLPVIDLRKRFGLPIGEATKDTRIVVAEINDATVGMLVDAVSEVLEVPEEAIEPPSPIVTTVDSAFIAGIAKVDKRLIILLDLEKVLSTEEKVDLQALQQIQAETVEEALVEEVLEIAPVEEVVEEVPVEEAVEEAPAEEVLDVAPVEEAIEEAPAEEAPEVTPVEEAVEEAPIEEVLEAAPAEEAVEEAPVEEVLEAAPAEEAVEEAPAEAEEEAQGKAEEEAQATQPAQDEAQAEEPLSADKPQRKTRSRRRRS